MTQATIKKSTTAPLGRACGQQGVKCHRRRNVQDGRDCHHHPPELPQFRNALAVRWCVAGATRKDVRSCRPTCSAARRGGCLASAFVTLFRGGSIPLDIREFAARGGLTGSVADQLELLLCLLEDPEPHIVQLAEQTLSVIPTDALAGWLAGEEATSDLRQAFAARGVTPAAGPGGSSPLPDPGKESDGSAGESRPQVLALLPVIERIKLALRGSREQRSVLIRDPNKVVSVAVLGSPKLNVNEIETYARMTSVQEEVLRVIGTSRQWIKHYPVISALVRNPKTPVAIAMPLVIRLNERDLKMVARDRNVPDGVRAAARRFLLTGQARRN